MLKDVRLEIVKGEGAGWKAAGLKAGQGEGAGLKTKQQQ